ncbi:M48 family metallopeptidase [Lentisphaerota bacterium WC36G]|nr:M48 family metallopeptidase [Lentisphaerae bacterium WC36]
MGLPLIIIILVYAVSRIVNLALELRNLSSIKTQRGVIPEEFKGKFDEESIDNSFLYTRHKLKFNLIYSAYKEMLRLIFIFLLINYYNELILSLGFGLKIDSIFRFILTGIVYVFILNVASTILSLPFDYYRIFRIEKRFSFNTMTISLWFVDLIKNLLLSAVVYGVLLSGTFLVFNFMPNFWWLPVWGLYFVLTIFFLYVSPYLIEPLFNKFDPIKNLDLIDRIKDMLDGAGINVKGVYKVDASKRTLHTNAYFTGIGRVKRIVLYDSLFDQLSNEEILAVLAHEVGHCKKHHVIKNLIFFEAISLIIAFVAFKITNSDALLDLFKIKMIEGVPVEYYFFTKIVILGFLASIAFWPLFPLFNYISRKFESQADDYACKIIGDGKSLASALQKLSKDNLANLHPDVLYATFHYSHPPVLERIRYLKEWEN